MLDVTQMFKKKTVQVRRDVVPIVRTETPHTYDHCKYAWPVASQSRAEQVEVHRRFTYFLHSLQLAINQ